jgi:hypothetical protein
LCGWSGLPKQTRSHHRRLTVSYVCSSSRFSCEGTVDRSKDIRRIKNQEATRYCSGGHLATSLTSRSARFARKG